MSYTCPRCGMTSHNPKDEQYRYCGNCHRYECDDEGRLDEGWEDRNMRRIQMIIASGA